MADFPSWTELKAQIAAALAPVSETRRWRSGSRYAPLSALAATDGPGNGELKLVPIIVPHAVTVSEIAARVTTAGSTGAVARIIVGDDNAGAPGKVIYSSAQLAATAVGKIAVTSPGISLTRGRYWLGIVVQGAPTTTPQWRAVNQFVPAQEEILDNADAYNKVAWSWFGQTGTLAVGTTIGAALGGAGDAPRVELKIA